MRTIGGAILKFLATSYKLSTTLILCLSLLFWVFYGALVVFALRWTWGFVVPKLMPGAVSQGLVVSEMPWSVAVVLSILPMVLNMFIDDASASETGRQVRF